MSHNWFESKKQNTQLLITILNNQIILYYIMSDI